MPTSTHALCDWCLVEMDNGPSGIFINPTLESRRWDLCHHCAEWARKEPGPMWEKPEPKWSVELFHRDTQTPYFAAENLGWIDAMKVVNKAKEIGGTRFVVRRMSEPHLTDQCSHAPGEGCVWCCQRCNTCTHWCPGCGILIEHKETNCKECAKL